MRENLPSRRSFLASTAALALTGSVPLGADVSPTTVSDHYARPPHPGKDKRKPLAALCTAYYPMSHAYHIVGRFVHGYDFGGRFHVPSQYIRTLYVDQFPDNDVSRDLTHDFDIPIQSSIAEALTNGSDRLAVEGILLIGEHGKYPLNDKGQELYPRYEMMEQIAAVFRKTGQSVPVFVDKHLSYSWAKAKKMADWATELKFPLMAGSSLPVTWRRPEVELPLGTPVEDALVACYGQVERYGFHGLETLQAMVERRKGGETGIRAVTCLSGADVWKAGDAGRWSWELLNAALSRSETLNPGDIRRNVGLRVGKSSLPPATAFLIEYRDGLRGTVLMLNNHVHDFTFAARLKGEVRPVSCLFRLPMGPGARFFDCLVHNIEKLFETGRVPYPLERTLLTTGALDALMGSLAKGGEPIKTPELAVQYTPPADSGFVRGGLTAP
jgi:hypothetical protein